MKLREIMTKTVIRIHPEETVAVAARQLEHYNIGALPVCDHGGKLYGVVTDRDLVTRCLAVGRHPEQTKVREVMTGTVICGAPDMETGAAANLMGRKQIRRLPVVENGCLCGVVSLRDLAIREETVYDAVDALENISNNFQNLQK